MDFTKLYDEVQNSLIFTKAYNYANNRHILSYNDRRDGSGTGEISSLIQGASGRYSASLNFTNGIVKGASCTCASYEKNLQPCKHIIALTYVAEERQQSSSSKNDLEPRLSPMFTAYRSLINKKISISKDRKIRVIPYLQGSNCEYTVRFKTGRDKLYVIKDLDEFAGRVIDGDVFSYSDKLSFSHVLQSFDEQSSELVKYIVGSRGSVAVGNAYYSQKSCRCLSGTLIDLLFDLYVGKGLQTDLKDVEITFSLGEPTIKFCVKNQGGYFTVSSQNSAISLIEGLAYAYVLIDSVIYRIEKAGGEVLHPLISQLGGDKNIMLSPDQLKLWFANIVPLISPYCMVEYIGVDMEKYRPLPLKAELYLDTDNVAITARLKCYYGEKEVNIYSNEYTSSSGRLFENEMQLKAVIDKFFDYDGESLLAVNADRQYELITSGLTEVEKFADIFATDNFNNIKVNHRPALSVGIRINGELLTVETRFDDSYTPSQLQEILEAYRQKKKYVKISSGTFIDLEGANYGIVDELSQLAGMSPSGLLSGETTVNMYRAMYFDKLLQSSGIKYNRDEQFKAVISKMKSFEDSDFVLGEEMYKTMRHYQRVGYRWLKTLAYFGFGGILADDMGLGKSLQTIAFLGSLEENLPSVIVCPSSLILNWQNEFTKFSPDTSVITVYGSKKQREEKLKCVAPKMVVITSYELLRQDIDIYEQTAFAATIIDEGQYIKNHATKNAHAVKALKSKYRFALTGTPIENNIAELWSIFDFIMPGYLHSYSRFKDTFESRIVKGGDAEATAQLHKMVAPFILRRLKKDVLSELPPKIDNLISLPLENEQRDIYAATLSVVLGNIQNITDINTSRIAVLSYLTKLRQICCDPTLAVEGYEGNSVKLDALMETIETSISGGHKVLVFSQFTSMLAIVKRKLQELGIEYYLLQGDTKKEDRMAMVDRFNADSTPVFLLSLKAGGTGLNLTGADVVVHYDPWWNLSVQNQATDRAYRIGQNKSVKVYRLVIKDTVEEKIIKLQEKKRDLFDSIIKDGEVDISRMAKQEILDLLSI